MAYTKQNFTDGNILQASQLAKMEDAILENEKKVDAFKSPTKLSELENDAGYLKSFTETDPTVPAWAKATTKPSYTAGEVGADPAGTAANAVGEHNVDPESHPDIRLFLSELSERLNAVANSDDETLDQLAEVVAYIKANRDLISQVTTGKVSVSDIVNNLATNVSDKPLSAAQGVALKALADGNTSSIENLQRAVAAIVQAYEETADAVYKITPHVVGERLVFGGAST